MNLIFNHVISHVITISPELLSRVDKLMATLADFTAKLDSVDAKTTEVSTKVADLAAVIADLKAKVAAGGLTVDEEAQVLEHITAHETVLDAVKDALDAAK